jgi:hypothetical protein
MQACFNWASCSPASIERAVVLYDAEGVVQADDPRGSAPACPVVPAADGQCGLTRSQAGHDGAMFSPQGAAWFLRKASIRTLTTTVWTYDARNSETAEAESGHRGRAFFCGYGLAVQTPAPRACNRGDDRFGNAKPRIGHADVAYGLVSEAVDRSAVRPRRRLFHRGWGSWEQGRALGVLCDRGATTEGALMISDITNSSATDSTIRARSA